MGFLRVISVLAVIAATAPAVIATGQDGAVLPPLGVENVRRVEIVDHWFGFSDKAPIDARYRLERRRGAGTFTGTGTLRMNDRVDGHFEGVRHGPLAITVPDSAMASFLAALAATPLTEGEYRPSIQVTDSYPVFTLRLRTSTGVVEFYSESQGEYRRPWRVEVAGRRYVSDSDVPARAMRIILPYLRRAELDRMFSR
jgi:hypothetical protein